MKKIITLLMLSSLVLLTGCGANETLIDGTYTVNSTELIDGFSPSATVQITDGKIASVMLDDVTKTMQSKSAMSYYGDYNIEETAVEPWHVQIQNFADYVVSKNGVDTLKFTSYGSVDAISSCSINVENHAELISVALESAVFDSSCDGTYSKMSIMPDADGYYPSIEVSISSGKIKSVFIDAVNPIDFSSKIEAEQNGTVFSNGKTFEEQSKELADYIVKNNKISGFEFNEDATLKALSNNNLIASDYINLLQTILIETRESTKTLEK